MVGGFPYYLPFRVSSGLFIEFSLPIPVNEYISLPFDDRWGLEFGRPGSAGGGVCSLAFESKVRKVRVYWIWVPTGASIEELWMQKTKEGRKNLELKSLVSIWNVVDFLFDMIDTMGVIMPCSFLCDTTCRIWLWMPQACFFFFPSRLSLSYVCLVMSGSVSDVRWFVCLQGVEGIGNALRESGSTWRWTVNGCLVRYGARFTSWRVRCFGLVSCRRYEGVEGR